MTGNEKKMCLVYAMGMARGQNDRMPVEKHIERVHLGDLAGELKDYILAVTFNPDNRNDRYSLYVKKQFGVEETLGNLISVEDGWDLDHMCHLLVSALEMDMAERKEETEE